ncbi:MAG: hypothetical protein IT379_22990 [Deltaproteobacteria bacterium]|nr:hypothetical protein [Deltaproteobacteria bacterium]
MGNARFEAFCRMGLSAVLHELGEIGEAELLVERARAIFRDVGDARFAGLAVARLGALRARRGDVAGARASFAEARAAPAQTPEPWWRRAIETLELLLVPRHEAAAVLGQATDARDAGAPTSSLRIAERIVRASLDAGSPEHAHGAGRLGIARDGSFLDPLGAPRASLRRRHALRSILALLVERRVHAPGEPTSVDELVAAGWPGERMTPASARTRLYVAVRSLRELGLRDVLVTSRGGYLLHPAVEVTLLDADG